MILLELLVIALGTLALVWVIYAAFRDAIEGREGLGPVVVLAVAALVFMLVVGQGHWLVGLDTFSCSDRAEIVMDAVPGPAARKGTIEGWDLLNCTIYWRDRPRVWG